MFKTKLCWKRSIFLYLWFKSIGPAKIATLKSDLSNNSKRVSKKVFVLVEKIIMLLSLFSSQNDSIYSIFTPKDDNPKALG